MVASLAGATAALTLLVAVVATAGYLSTRRALEEASTNAAVATEAIDGILEHFTSRTALGSPGLLVDSIEGSTVDVQLNPASSREIVALLSDVLPYYERLAHQTPDAADLRRKVADANRRVGDIRQGLGQYDPAVAAYLHAIALYEEGQAGSNPDLRTDLARTYNELGRLYHTADQRVKARDAHRAALRLLDARGPGPGDDPQFQLELARTHYFLAVTAAPDSPDEGAPHIEKVISALAPLQQANAAGPRYRHLLGLCYRQRFYATAESQPAAARAALDEAIETLQQLATDFPRVPDYQSDLSETYAAVAESRYSLYPSQVVEERLERALDLAADLVQRYPDVPRYTMAQALFSHRLAFFLEVGGRLDEAKPLHTAAVTSQRALVKQFPEIFYHKVRFGEFANGLARLLLLQRRATEASPLLVEAIALLTPALEDHKDSSALHALLARSYGALEAAWREQGRVQEAAEARAKASEHRAAMR